MEQVWEFDVKIVLWGIASSGHSKWVGMVNMSPGKLPKSKIN